MDMVLHLITYGFLRQNLGFRCSWVVVGGRLARLTVGRNHPKLPLRALSPVACRV